MRIALRLGIPLLLFFQISLADGLNGLHSPNGFDVWAVGEEGLVFHSLDAGDTWSGINLGTLPFYDVFSVANTTWIVGEDGVCYVSVDGGATWSSQTLGITLRSLFFLDELNGWAAGDAGTIFHTTDGGDTWTTQTSGSAENLYSLTFVSASIGYAVGSAATVLKTEDAGASWSVLPNPGWTHDLYTVGGTGGVVYVGGQDGFCRRSADGGQTWSGINLFTDTRSDLRDLAVLSVDSVLFTGGGGYIRQSTNGGVSFTWAIHPMLASLSKIFFYDQLNGWASADGNNVVMKTTDGGQTWDYPAGTTVSRSWSHRLDNIGFVIGNTFVVNPWNKDYLYVAISEEVYMSGDRGESWTQTATIAGGSGSTHSFYISPKDTNLWIVAHTGGGDHVRRSTDRGATWTRTLERSFTSYGMPLEMNPDQPDTMLFAANGSGGTGEDGIVYLSKDFGETWDTLGTTTLRSPCDIVIVPDSANIVYIGDGITGSGSGQLWRSEDGGKSYEQKFSVTGSEIPTISISRHRNTEAYATAWSSGGVMRTQDLGTSWSSIAGTNSTWGTDIAKDDPNVVVYGSYGSGEAYFSIDGGNSFSDVGNSGSNYAYLAYDRGTFFALQSGGVWKLRATYTMPTSNSEAVALISPNGGESLVVGDEVDISWTSSGIDEVDIEWTVEGSGVWDQIADNVTAGAGVYSWTVPASPTEEARVRISDSEDGSPTDESDGTFSITVATMSVSPDSLAYGDVLVGESMMDTLRITNNGTATLVVTSVVTGDPVFTAGRTSFTIDAGKSDTLSVWFSPSMAGEYRDTLVISTNDPSGDRSIVLTGTGESTVDVREDDVLPREYVLEQNYPNPFNPRTEIRYGVPREGHVLLRVYTMLGEEVGILVDERQQAGWYTVSFGGTDLASGLYLYRLEAEDFVSVKKMMLLK